MYIYIYIMRFVVDKFDKYLGTWGKIGYGPMA